jgi:hypothetical protein
MSNLATLGVEGLGNASFDHRADEEQISAMMQITGIA